MSRISVNELRTRYVENRESPESIGKSFGVSGRTVRSYLDVAGIPRLGANHLRKGKSATWNLGLKRSEETKLLNSRHRKGKVPHNKGAGSKIFMCEACGTLVTDKPYRRKRTCSAYCKNVLMTITRGETHWNYLGEETGSNQRQRLWKDSYEWKKSVLKTNDHKCQKCGERRDKMHAHHIKPWAKFPNERFNVFNGACLCSVCHKKFHSLYGLKKSTEEDYLEWITK